MPVYVLALVSVNADHPEELAKYQAATQPLLKAAGAKIIEEASIGTVVAGQTAGDFMFIVEYPSMSALDSVFQSDEYKRVIPFRDVAFKSYSISIIGDSVLG